MFDLIVMIIIIAFIVLGILVLRQPDEFRVSRTLKMAVPVNVIFPHIHNLRSWRAWSPWIELDPNVMTTFGKIESGAGAKLSWKGNNKIGEGSMTILESATDKLIRYRLDFIKPMSGTNYAEFKFTEQGGQTLVVWSMYGKNNVISKIFGIFINCEKMVGAQFDKGLHNLKRVVEGK